MFQHGYVGLKHSLMLISYCDIHMVASMAMSHCDVHQMSCHIMMFIKGFVAM
jgi:hypothetical protein